MVSKAILFAVPLGCMAWGKKPQAMTENGQVEGTDNSGIIGILKHATVEAFYGIPYAAAPVGEKRLRPPQPFMDSWAPEVRKANKEGDSCEASEDCLFLNVHRPVGINEGPAAPVIVWIYGGGFIMGDALHLAGGKLRAYDPTNIVERHGHVFVGMNYRLGALGFMALPEMAAENPEGGAGNFGMLDQRAAMQWVQRNIRGFGGDPQKVTIQGESAGAMAVMFHLVSPASNGLFHGAIAESATIRQGCFFQNRSDSFIYGREWAALRGCNASGKELLTCVRQLPEKAFRKELWFHEPTEWFERRKHRKDHNASALPMTIPNFACPFFPADNWGAVVDGSMTGLPDWPERLLEAGEFNKVPLISGANINGGSMFGWLFPLLWGELPYPLQTGDLHKQYLGKVASWFLRNKEDQDKFLELYGGHDFDDQDHSKDTRVIDRVDRFWRDSFFLCPAREVAMHWSSHNQPVYEYVFSFDMNMNLPVIKDSTHGFELPFVFRNWILDMGIAFMEPRKYEKMADVMSCTWASFVRCQKPKCPGNPPPNCADVLETMPDWPAFSGQDRKYISLKHNSTIETIKSHVAFPNDEYPGDDRCDLWKTVDFGWQNMRRWPDAPEGSLTLV